MLFQKQVLVRVLHVILLVHPSMLARLMVNINWVRKGVIRFIRMTMIMI